MGQSSMFCRNTSTGSCTTPFGHVDAAHDATRRPIPRYVAVPARNSFNCLLPFFISTKTVAARSAPGHALLPLVPTFLRSRPLQLGMVNIAPNKTTLPVLPLPNRSR